MTPGERIGPYVVVAELGRGGMGLVLRARHSATGGDVALKVLDASLVDRDAVLRFDLEGQALARVAGDGIVPVHAAGVDGRRRWIALGLMAGGSLRDRLKTSGPWPWERAVELVRGLAATLGRCHAAGVVHRDLKPENILFDAAGRAHVADFGLVRDLGAKALTVTGTVLGTPAYMAPEQLEGLRVDARADVWALGVLLHELVAGERPWVGKQTVQLLARITATPRPRLADRGAPPELDAVLDGALTLDAEPRYPDAAALAAELGCLLARQAPPVVLARRARLRQRRLLGLSTFTALLFVACVAAWWVTDRRHALAERARALGVGAATVDSWRAGLRAARLDAAPPPAHVLSALEDAVEGVEAQLQDLASAEVAADASAKARTATLRGRLELAIARGDPAACRSAATALRELQVPPAEDAHLRLLAELAGPVLDRDAVDRELSLARTRMSSRGREAADLRVAVARGELALDRMAEAISALDPAFVTGGVPTRGELLLRARCAGAVSQERSSLARYSLDISPPPDESGEELGAAVLDGLLGRVSARTEGEFRRLVELVWDLELDYRERWRRLDPAAGTSWPAKPPVDESRVPVRAARPPRSLVRGRHAPALRVVAARLDDAVDHEAVLLAARAHELLFIADPDVRPPTRAWERISQLFCDHAVLVQRGSEEARAALAKTLCRDLTEVLRLGLPTLIGAIPEIIRAPLRRAASERLAEDERDWAREALVCVFELHQRRNFFSLTRRRERSILTRPLLGLAASRLLRPETRAGLALNAAEFGLAAVGDVDQPQWAEPAVWRDRAPLPWTFEAAVARRRRPLLVQARDLLETHYGDSCAPDLFEGILAQIALALGDPAEAERLARKARGALGEPHAGRPRRPDTMFKSLPGVLTAVRVRALRELGRDAEAEEVRAEGDE